MTPLPPSAGVIGWPVAHSKSPLIHRFWLAKLGLDGDYGRFPVEPGVLGSAMRTLPALGLRGVNVTIPHKIDVMQHLDWIDPIAEQIGAVNTVVVEDWLLKGYNTDAAGFIEPLLPILETQQAAMGKNQPPARFVLLIGCGGAALAIAAALEAYGFTFITYNRDPERAKRQLGRYVWDDDLNVALERLATPTDMAFDDRTGVVDLVVNTTSLGMTGQPPLALDFSHVPSGAIVYDIVYSPLESPLLAAARARGHRTIDGLAMLIGQAAAAFALFFGQPAPREHDAELRALLMG